MPRTIKTLLIGLTLVSGAQGSQVSIPPPPPVLPIPTARQLEWQYREMALFIHFTINTFTDREWGDGSESPRLFSPSELDVGQWVSVAKEFGFKSIILTAKHHDGFCLWPSRYTQHSVKNSPWRDGRGDIVKELSEACRENGVKLGLYLSPWDRHEPSYGNEEEYNQFYMAQLQELLLNYGPLAEVWFDGAKGEDAKDMKYYFDEYWSLVRQLQPEAVMFSDEGPDVRWIGNERGSAGPTNWSMLDRSKVSVGNADTQYLNSGDREGQDWLPGETDVSIRRGWFWHEDQAPKSVDELLDIYFHSVGRNSVLLLNVPPDKRGLIPDKDIERLREFKRELDRIFSHNLVAGSSATSDQVWGGNSEFGPENTLDGNRETFWAAEGTNSETQLTLDFGTPKEFNIILLQEPIHLGQRIASFRIEKPGSSGWEVLTHGTTIGHKRLIRIGRTTAQSIRIVVSESRATPLLSEIGIFLDEKRKE